MHYGFSMNNTIEKFVPVIIVKMFCKVLKTVSGQYLSCLSTTITHHDSTSIKLLIKCSFKSLETLDNAHGSL